VLVATGISKRFGRTAALTGVDFHARGGEIHALLGENGAGKSTLINVLAGRVRPDRGSVVVNGVALETGSAAAALAGGIAAVYQSPLLFEQMRWEENLALGGFCPNGLDLRQVATDAALLARELGFSLPPPGAILRSRSVAERVRLEILRALSFKPNVLILDEPTGVLGPGELEPFLQLLRRLRAQGRVVILVTHKLAEALAVADRITMLRHGRVVAETTAAATSEAELARLMIGEIAIRSPEAAARKRCGPPLVKLDQITLDDGQRRQLDRVSLELTAGSITGIAGIDGNGQDELVEIVAGLRRPTSGTVHMRDSTPFLHAVAVIPQDRDSRGLILDLSLWENLLLPRTLRKRLGARFGWIRRAAAAGFCHELMKNSRVLGDGAYATAASLSGGNRQRFVVARALAAAPQAIVAHDICRGLDLSAAAELRGRLRDYAARGGAVLLISSDLDELLTLCDELHVISSGRLCRVPDNIRDSAEIGLMMSGAPR
jgi:ABC-type uncharacterized transport system ATPase subunit